MEAHVAAYVSYFCVVVGCCVRTDDNEELGESPEKTMPVPQPNAHPLEMQEMDQNGVEMDNGDDQYNEMY